MSEYLQMKKNSWEFDFTNLTSFHEPQDYSLNLDDITTSQSPTSDQQGLITKEVSRRHAEGEKERWALGKSEANDCSRHKGTHVTHYCQKCHYSFCRKCETDAHPSHPTMQITEKYQEMTSKLMAS